MALRMKHTYGLMSLVAVYAPTTVYTLYVKEVFYHKLASVADYPPMTTLGGRGPWDNLRSSGLCRLS